MSKGPMHTFTTIIFNRLARRFAGAPHSPFAMLHHVGRRSGKPYETPMIVQRVSDGYVIALTYGPEVDWYRNVMAAGHCKIVWQGKEYAIEKLEPIDAQKGLMAFPQPAQSILRLRGTEDFVGLKYRGAHAAAGS